MSSIGSVPETAGDESLEDTDESDDTYSRIIKDGRRCWWPSAFPGRHVAGLSIC